MSIVGSEQPLRTMSRRTLYRAIVFVSSTTCATCTVRASAFGLLENWKQRTRSVADIATIDSGAQGQNEYAQWRRRRQRREGRERGQHEVGLRPEWRDGPAALLYVSRGAGVRDQLPRFRKFAACPVMGSPSSGMLGWRSQTGRSGCGLASRGIVQPGSCGRPVPDDRWRSD